MAQGMTARQLVEMVTARPGYMSAIGTRVLEAEPGRVHLAIDRRPDLVQFNGFFHGGAVTALADHAAGGAVTTSLPAGRIAVTIDLHMNFLSPADGESIVAKAKAVQVGSTVSVAHVDVFTISGDKEKLCSICTVTLRTVDMPKPAGA